MLIGPVYLFLALLLYWAVIVWQGWWLVLLYPATSMLLVAAGYLWLGASVFGKRNDGTLPVMTYVVFLPYLLVYWVGYDLVTGIYEQFRGENPVDELCTGVYVARRPEAHEIPADVALVVDLTCEYPVEPGIAARLAYRAFPILDGSVPPLADLANLLAELAAVKEPLLIHCAIGHGRTGLVACGLLLARGLTADPDEAIRMAQARRPYIRLNTAQRAMLHQLAEVLRERRSTNS